MSPCDRTGQELYIWSIRWKLAGFVELQPIDKILGGRTDAALWEKHGAASSAAPCRVLEFSYRPSFIRTNGHTVRACDDPQR
jgi:hypothetical protein